MRLLPGFRVGLFSGSRVRDNKERHPAGFLREKKKKTKCVFRNLMMTMSAKADLICREDVKENWSLRDGFSLPRLDESPK